MIAGERFNTARHLAGAALALVGSAVLIVRAAPGGEAGKFVSVSIYRLILVLMSSASTQYDGLRGRAKRVFRALDHQRI